MKKMTLFTFTLVLLVYIGGGVLLAQPKYQPKYLRQDDKAFNDLTIRTDNNGRIGGPMDRVQKDRQSKPQYFLQRLRSKFWP
jgi:hypothetical protein